MELLPQYKHDKIVTTQHQVLNVYLTGETTIC